MRSHIAILKRHYLDIILFGRKRIECRLAKIACPPFRSADTGEQLLLKESSGPVRGRAVVEKVEFFEGLTPKKISQIRRRHNKLILGQDDFWLDRKNCRFGSLIWLTDIEAIEPYRIKSYGRRGWIVFQDGILCNRIQSQETELPDRPAPAPWAHN